MKDLIPANESIINESYLSFLTVPNAFSLDFRYDIMSKYFAVRHQKTKESKNCSMESQKENQNPKRKAENDKHV